MSDYLCQELIVEIFTRLPPKSLLRFRLLSKSLCSCISSPGFIRMHTFRSPQKILFLHSINDSVPGSQPIYTLHEEDELPLCLCPNRGYIGITTKAWFPRSPNFRTIGSCNGTFCLRTRTNLTLWNPSIRRKLSVPEFPWSSELNEGAIGFGFDPINDDYKIVWVSNKRDICSFVYAVKTGAWCKIASPKPQFSRLICEAFFFNGVLHWAGFYYDMIKSQNIRLSCILTFDLSTHVFGKIPSPGPTSQWMTMELTTIQDSLASISYCENVGTWIWAWRDASWFAVLKLGTSELLIDRALQLQPQPNNNGDLLVNVYMEGLQVYNPTTGVRSRVVNFDAAFSVEGFRRCVETLHLLNMGETACETTQL